MTAASSSERPSWPHYYMGLASAASARADCRRRKVGAVVVHEHHVFGTGYNGSPRGSTLSCLQGDCPRGQHQPHIVVYWTGIMAANPKGEERELCAWDGKPWPCPDAVAPGSDYNRGPGKCIAIHAEMNALTDALRHGLPAGGELYCNEKPCDDCVRYMQACQIKFYCYRENDKLLGPVWL